MSLRPLYQILLLLVITLGLYYSAIFNPVNLIDDSQILDLFESKGGQGLRDWLLPGESFYYRPFLMLTFYLDYLIWNNQPSFLHLENILLHAVNSLLVYALARKVFGTAADLKSFLPFFTALLFAIHPINTESVNWIAGRSDLLATFFVLSAFNLLWRGLTRQSNMMIFAASLIFMAGVLTKEVMIFAFPVGLAMIVFSVLPDLPARSKAQKWWQSLLFSWPFLSGGLLATARMMISGTGLAAIEKMFAGYRYGLFDTIRVFFKVWGFYIKKLFLPLPLNFGILSVNDSYVWLGLALFPVFCYLLWRGDLAQRSLAVAFYLITPALIIAVADVTWTPVAERYLYLSSSFFAIAMAGFLRWVIVSFDMVKVGWGVAMGMLAFQSVATAQRNLVWQSNLRLYEDTLEKSPEFVRLQNEVAILKREAGDYDQAYDRLAKLNRRDDKDSYLYYVNKARFLMQQGNLIEARNLVMSVAAEKASLNSGLLKVLARIDEKRLFVIGEDEKNDMITDLSETYQLIFGSSAEPAALYRAGQLELSLGNESMAQELFARAYQHAPEDAYYREAAGKLAKRLNKMESE